MRVTSPATSDIYCLEFDLTQNGRTFSSMGRRTLQVNVFVSPHTAYNVSWGAHTVPASMVLGTSSNVMLNFTNNGTGAWAAGAGATAVKLTYRWRSSDCASVLQESNSLWWLASLVPVGATVSNYRLTVATPANVGSYCLEFDLTRAGQTFSSMDRPTLRVMVSVEQNPLNVIWGLHGIGANLPAGSPVKTSVSLTNTGSTTWQAGSGASAVMLTYLWRSGDCAAVVQQGGELFPLGANVPAGGSVTLGLTLVTPIARGTYCLEFDLVRNGVTFSSMGRPTLRVIVIIGP
jgi:hypothetical protein